MVPPYMLRHRPLITPRIAFKPAPPAPFPTITPRIEFTPERLKRQRALADDPKSSIETKRQRRSSVPRASPSAPHDENPDLYGGNEDDEDDDGEEDDDGTPSPPPADGPSRLIPKPLGEPGRRKSGGYSLDRQLIDKHQWSKAAVEDLHKAVRAMGEGSLDLTVSFSKQDKQKVQDICNKIQERWPDLARYENCWPVRSVLKLALKYWSESSRRAHVKVIGERVRSAALGP